MRTWAWWWIAALACDAFGYWGLQTVAGRRVFDEMAGMIPLAGMLVGGLCAVLGCVVAWRGGRRAG